MSQLIAFMPGCLVRQGARADLNATLEFLTEQDEKRAARFARALSQTFADLVKMPRLGSPRVGVDSRLRDLRMWPVRDFKSYLIYYVPLASGDGVEIVRVLHHSRDFETHLTDDMTFEGA